MRILKFINKSLFLVCLDVWFGSYHRRICTYRYLTRTLCTSCKSICSGRIWCHIRKSMKMCLPFLYLFNFRIILLLLLLQLPTTHCLLIDFRSGLRGYGRTSLAPWNMLNQMSSEIKMLITLLLYVILICHRDVGLSMWTNVA